MLRSAIHGRPLFFLSHPYPAYEITVGVWRLPVGNSALNRLIFDCKMRWCTTWFDKPDEGEAEDVKCKGAGKKQHSAR